MVGYIILFVLIIFGLILVSSCVKIVPQAHALVIERLGGYQGTWGVGLHFKVPFIDRVAKRVILKEQVVDFAPQPVITKDNVPCGLTRWYISRLPTPSCLPMAWKTPLWPLKT